MLRGIDISAWQGGVDLASVTKRYGLNFVGIKATEGSASSDRYFSQNWAHAKTAGLTRIAYHFARPEESSAQSQADRLLSSAADAGPGDLLCLDLEASKLSQNATNAWACLFGDRLRQRAPHVRTVSYLGSGYASSSTGRGLADHFDMWWYPQYPSIASTTSWPSSFSPWLPSGITTGWARPHIWQWTDKFDGTFDANISTLTIDQLAGVGGQPQEKDMPFAGQIQPGKGSENEISFPRGSLKALGLVYDNSLSLPEAGIEPQPTGEVRVAIHYKDGTHDVRDKVQVGVGVVDPKQPKKTFKTVIQFTNQADVDYVVLVRLDDGKRPIGWDMS
jgi:hypothetical protein